MGAEVFIFEVDVERKRHLLQNYKSIDGDHKLEWFAQRSQSIV